MDQMTARLRPIVNEVGAISRPIEAIVLAGHVGVASRAPTRGLCDAKLLQQVIEPGELVREADLHHSPCDLAVASRN